jgi:transcriptional regulator with XRE-family HTH domain
MDANQWMEFREQFGLSQQDIADLAGVDVMSVDEFMNNELLPPQGQQGQHELIVIHDKVFKVMLKLIVQRYPEKLKAAVAPVLELAKTYPEGSVMRNFLNSQENWLKLLEEPPQK